MAIRAGILGTLEVPLVLGTMQLSTADEILPVIHFALDQGIRLLDCHCDGDLHGTELLVRHALDLWHGPNDQVKILTKVPSRHPDHMRRSVDECLLALRVDRLFLLQLDAHHPHVPIDDMLPVLADLQRQGKVEHLGLCNVTPVELHQAQRHFHVAAVQNELSVLHRDSARNGLVALTQEQGIVFLASHPLGTRANRLAKDRILLPLSQRHRASTQEMALAALLDASPNIVPIIEASTIDSVRSCLAATHISLDVSDRTALSVSMSLAPDPEALAAARQLFVKDEGPEEEIEPTKKARRPMPVDSSFVVPTTAWAKVRPCFGLAPTPEVVIVMGIPGAGKSFLADDYEGRGYVRISRGRRRVDDLVPRLHKALEERHKLVVLDDNYPTRLSRAPVIAAAHSHGLPVRCTHLQIPLAEAQVNITLRMIERYGRLLEPEEMRACRRTDRSVATPADLRRWLRSFEAPTIEEGFSAVDTIPFVRRMNPAHKQKGILLDVDGTIRRSRSGAAYPCHPDDVELLPGRFEVLLRWVASGYHLFFVSNQCGIAEGKLTKEIADATFQRTAELLKLPVTEIAYCPHQAHPVTCWCHKPMPGLGVFLMELHRLARKHLIVVGDIAGNAEFASGLGARFWDPRQFFGWGG